MSSIRLRYLASLITSGSAVGPRPMLSLDLIDGGNGRLLAEPPTCPNLPDSGAATALSGDVLFGKLRPYLAKVHRVTGTCYASTELMCLRPGAGVDSRWLSYLLLSRPLVEWAVASSDGTKMPRTSWEKLGEYRSLRPDVLAQRTVADFLDTETARIDALIGRKRRLIELLDLRTRSLVSRLTSTGPEVSVRRVTSLRTSGPRGWANRVSAFGSDPFVRSGNLTRDSINLRTDNLVMLDAPTNSEARRSQLAIGDVVIGITGANTGWVAAIDEQAGGGYVSQHVAILRPDGVAPRWLALSLFADQAQSQLLGGQYGGTKQQLGLDELANLRIRVPDPAEQGLRLAALDRAWTCSEKAKQRLVRQVDLLGEHRQALITAAVTGELSVPGVAA